MRKAAQGCLQSADENGNVPAPDLTQAPAIHQYRTVGTIAGFVAGRVGVVIAAALGCGVVCNHAVDIAAGDEKGKPGLAEFQKIRIMPPIRLRQHGNGIAVRLEHTGYDCRPEARMIDIGITGQIDKIRLFNALFMQLLWGDRKEIGHGKDSFLGGIGRVRFMTGFRTACRSRCAWQVPRQIPWRRLRRSQGAAHGSHRRFPCRQGSRLPSNPRHQRN